MTNRLEGEQLFQRRRGLLWTHAVTDRFQLRRAGQADAGHVAGG